MANAPGFLPDFGDRGQRGWTEYIERHLIESLLRNPAPKHLTMDGDPSLLPDPVGIEWNGFPVRTNQCLNRPMRELASFVDWTNASGQVGRAYTQEEYLEWRAVRGPDGKIIQIEFTTETPDYWAKLARYEPARALEIIARFAGEEPSRIDPRLIWGNIDPFSIDPFGPKGEELENAYRRSMYASRVLLPNGSKGYRPPASPYNNGIKAITHMANPVNSIEAAVALAAHAAFPLAKRVDGSEAPLEGGEAIATGTQSAVDCRNSDPTIVGSVVEAAFHGRKVALMDPIGLYILSADHSRVLDKNSAPVPAEWFAFSRGTRAQDNPTRRNLFTRCVFRVPPGQGMVVGDLTDDTGEAITSGAQIARLIQIVLYAKVSDRGVVAEPRRVFQADTLHPLVCDRDQPECSIFRNGWQEFQSESASGSGPAPLMRRGGG